MLKNLLLTVFLLPVLFVESIAQGSYSDDINKILSKLQHTGNDTVRLRLLTEASFFYLYQKPLTPAASDSAWYFTKEALILSRQLNNAEGFSINLQTKFGLLLAKGMRKQEARLDATKELTEAAALKDTLISTEKKRGKHSEAEMYRALIYQYSLAGIEDGDTLIPMYARALELFRLTKDKVAEAQVLLKLGDLQMDAADYVGADRSFKDWLALVPYLKDHEHAVVNSLLGITNTYLGNLPMGIAYGLESEKIAEDIGDTTEFMSQLYGFLGTTYEGLKDLDQAQKYYRKGLAVAEQQRDTAIIHILAANTAKVMAPKDLRGSVQYMETILQQYPLKGIDEDNMRVYIRLMNGHMGFKDYEGAQKYCDTLIILLNRLPEQSPVRSAVLSPIIQFLVVSGQYDQARQYLPMYDRLAQKHGVITFQREVQYRYYKVDSAQGHFADALEHFKRYKALNDTLYNKDKAKEIAELEIRYETEKKDNDLKLKEQNIALLTRQSQLQQVTAAQKDQALRLKEKDIALLVRDKELQQALARKNEQHLQLQEQELELKKKNISLLTQESLLQQARLTETRSTRNFMLAGAVMLLLLLALGYSRYRAKQKANREINSKNRELQHLLEEKEWLLKEIHHRVKNNLQTIVSLLESQSYYLKDDARLAIQDSQNRVNAMSLIHQKLYQGDNVASISLTSYLPELVSHLKDCFTVRNQVSFLLHTDPVELDVSQAVPLGLILNEAITNALKYAFPVKGPDQSVSVHIAEEPGRMIRLTIRDNGVGLPDSFELQSCSGLGLKLMQGLTDDLEGQFSITNDQGTCIEVTFTANTLLDANRNAVAA